MMPALEYVFDYLRQEAFVVASAILDAMGRLGLVSPLTLRVLTAASEVLV